jgi:spermidine/putrescine transport system ATP-binding protein
MQQPGQLARIDSLIKSYGSARALKEVSFTIERGEFLAVLGPSGCGKTTLLRCIAGLENPESGTILIEGQDCTHLPAYQRPLNTVFQSFALFPHMTVFDNIAYGPRRRRDRLKTLSQRVSDTLLLTGMNGFEDRFPSQLSGGQQQRVALARAIVNEPKLLLLDEPMSALDQKLRQRMQIELKELQTRLGIAFVLVTHDQEEAMTMADRIIVLNAGTIEQIGSPSVIYEEPATRFVADFIGDANFLSAPFLRASGYENPLATDGVTMIRPERLKRVNGETDGFITFPARVDKVVNAGGVATVYVTAHDTALLLRDMRVNQDNLRSGESIVVGFKPEWLHPIDVDA